MEDEPRGFLCNINVTTQLTGGYALLVATDKIHSHKPLLQRQFGILKDGSHKAGETLVTMGTLELIVTVTALIYMGATAERAHYNLAPTLLGDEVTATLVTVEMVDEGDKGIEMFKCKSHSLKVFTSYLYLKTMGIFQKVQRFSRWTSMFYGIIRVIRYIIPFDKAREYYDKAIVLLQKLYGPSHKYIAAVYDHIAESFVDEGNLEVAAQWFDNEISNLRNSDGDKRRDIPDVYLRLTDLYIERKDLIAAEQYCNLGLKESNYPFRRAPFYQRLGMIARESGDHKTALSQFKRELACYKNEFITLEPDLGRAYLSIGSELNALGEYDKARVNLQKGLKMYQHLLELRVNNPDADPDVVGETFDYVGLFLIELDDIKGGIDHFRKAIQYYGPRSKKAAYLRQYIKDIKKAVS